MLLHTFCTQLNPEPLAECLLSQCHFLTRLGRTHLMDYSNKRVSRNSFINRAKYIAELILFEWLHYILFAKSIFEGNLDWSLTCTFCYI